MHPIPQMHNSIVINKINIEDPDYDQDNNDDEDDKKAIIHQNFFIDSNNNIQLIFPLYNLRMRQDTIINMIKDKTHLGEIKKQDVKRIQCIDENIQHH